MITQDHLSIFGRTRNLGASQGIPASDLLNISQILLLVILIPVVLRGKGIYGEVKATFEQRRYREMGSELRLSEDTYDHQGSPKKEKYAHLHDYSQRFPQTSQPYEEPWDFPEDIHYFLGAKKMKTESFLSNKELPEYPQSDYNPERHGFSRSYSDFSQADSSNGNFEGGPSGYNQLPYRPMNLPLALGERGDRWKESYDNFEVSSGSQIANPVDRRRFTPESDQPSFNVWKWEGTIAKGGTPVCHACCFPVGKLLDITLPEFWDCTARTGIDMLSKHYYKAASAWVVFFATQSDVGIEYYNEFMLYLGEKQRAAVAKLDDKNTLFLVPPSDFSEKVLKVPGKLSISGVVLRLENPSSNFRSPHQEPGRKDMRLLSLPRDTSYTKPSTPSESIHSFTSAPPRHFQVQLMVLEMDLIFTMRTGMSIHIIWKALHRGRTGLHITRRTQLQILEIDQPKCPIVPLILILRSIGSCKGKHNS